MSYLGLGRKMKCNKSNRLQCGLTLVEVAITLAILAVITGIAYPSYLQQVRKSHRMVALSDMLAIQHELERGYDNGYHFEQIVSAGTCSICDSQTTRYRFEITAGSTVTYIIKATAQSSQQQTKDSCLDDDKSMTLNALGVTTPAACWGQ
ncbi:fimbrial protein [Vibrio sp. ER1A]|nr:fimbrial protein [Vibrio sp. ER1A]